MKTLKPNKRWIAFGLVFFVAFVLGVHAGNSQVTAVPKPTPTPAVEVSREIVGLGQQVGLGYKELQLTHAQIGAPQNVRACDPAVFQACYDPNTYTIYLYMTAFTAPGASPATSLAYEYSHFVWQITPDNEKAELKPMMDAWYATHKTAVDRNNAGLIKAEGGYGSEAFENELHSIVCTEVADNQLAPALLAHCAAFLPNRSALHNLY